MTEGSAYGRFCDNLDSVWVLHRVAFEQNRMNLESDVSEIYRAEIVLLVTALDAYIHEVTADLGTERLMNNKLWKKNLTCRCGIPPLLAKRIKKEPNKHKRMKMFRMALLKRIQVHTYTRSEAISNAFKKCNISNIWNEVSYYSQDDTITITKNLDAIVKERNLIVHQAHVNPATGQKYLMTEQHVEEVRAFISGIVGKIDFIIRNR